MNSAGGDVSFFSAVRGSGVRVLVVDHDPDSRLRLATLLEDDGLLVTQIVDGGEVPGACEHRLPDLVLMDVDTPDVSGLQALVRMKADERTSEIPVILMSTFSDPDLEPDFIDMGAEICLDKQAQNAVIRGAVEAVLA
ncbi:MAG: response regulator [Chloroflexi bacterium]|nr:response regulator [Chloroflexota bacterium]